MGWIILTVVLLAVAVLTYKLRLGTQTTTRSGYGGDTTTQTFGLGSNGMPVITLAAVVLWLVFTAFTVTYTIEAGNIGLVKTFKEYTGQSGSGLHMKAPWQSVDEVNGRVQKATIKMNGGDNGSAVSKETQPVYATLTVNYRVDLAKAKSLYSEVGENYYGSIIEPRVQQAFKAITVKYVTADIAPNREKIRNEAKDILEKQLDDYGIRVDDLLIKDLDFSPAFIAAIEDKQVAGQEALAAQARVAKTEAEARQKIAAARGDAEATRINGQALDKNPLYLQQLAIEKLNPNVQVIMMPANGQNMILPPQLFGKTG